MKRDVVTQWAVVLLLSLLFRVFAKQKVGKPRNYEGSRFS